ncbi:hypothetical protein ACOMHN_009352 [Nucella lapillus]
MEFSASKGKKPVRAPRSGKHSQPSTSGQSASHSETAAGPQPSTSGQSASHSETAAGPQPSTSGQSASHSATATRNQCLLPEELRKALPAQDRQWISRALFHPGPRGKPELDPLKVDRMWYSPPEASLSHPKMPCPDRYFAHRLCLWFPRRLWGCRLICPHPDCNQQDLTSAGLYNKTVRQVLDVDSYYLLMAEYLECRQCSRKVPSWHESLLAQLDLGHRSRFPAVLTYRYAADKRVVRLLRQRGLGNGPMQIWKGLREQHSEAWLETSLMYLTDVEAFVKASARGLISPVQPEAPPNAVEQLPSFSWLQTVYVKDVLQRLDDVKASITSTFGHMLKLDSTKKIVKKLAGHARNTAARHTNVGNEHGQVLMSVVTAQEGEGLQAMADGLMQRYRQAAVQPPQVLYVDRDCCSQVPGRTGKAGRMFASWSALHVRLDIWHFMRRLACGVNTESHPLYAPFMGAMSVAIFTWDEEDFDALKAAKRSQLQEQGVVEPSDGDIRRSITKQELALHCRRATRGTEETTLLLNSLIDLYTQPHATDTLGVPLLDAARAWQTWEEQKRHVKCIQDPEGVSLYQETSPLRKGGHVLKTYRCARGSTSLESFHLHLNRFIPGNSASDLHYQVYLLDGLKRWNQDRAQAATGNGRDPLTYSGLLCHGVNTQYQRVFGQPIIAGFSRPHKYTGELIGMEYLYSQQPGSELYSIPESEELEADTDGGESGADEGFQEADPEDLIADRPDQVVECDQVLRDLQQGLLDTHPAQPHKNRPSKTLLSGQLDNPQGQVKREVTGSSTATATAVPSCSSVLQASSSSASQAQSPEEDTSVEGLECDCLPGHDLARQLASYVVSLRDHCTITDGQAAQLVRLFNQLLDYDKRPTVFPPRHRLSLGKGRFGRSKATTAAGVDSSRRCFLGTGSGPAQSPSVNRYSEAIVIQLLDVFPDSVMISGKRVDRFALVLNSFNRMQLSVCDNPIVRANTTLQLPLINMATLRAWFKMRVTCLERQGLQMHLQMPVPAAPSKDFPLARKQPATLDEGQGDIRHEFKMPQNTAGTGKVRRKRAAVKIQAAVPIAPSPSTSIPLLCLPSAQPGSAPIIFTLPQQMHATLERPAAPPPPQPSTAGTSSMPAPSTSQPQAVCRKVSRTTAWRQLKRQQLEEELGVSMPKSRRKESTVCGQCQCPREPQTHGQYYGVWWCRAVSPLSFAQWKDQQKQSRNIRKEMKSETPPP